MKFDVILFIVKALKIMELTGIIKIKKLKKLIYIHIIN